MDPGQGLQLLNQGPAARATPVHYDDYGVFRSPMADFVRLVQISERPTQVSVPRSGETAGFPGYDTRLAQGDCSIGCRPQAASLRAPSIRRVDEGDVSLRRRRWGIVTVPPSLSSSGVRS